MEAIGVTEWANTPLEYKVGAVRGQDGTTARILRLNPETGATELVPVRIVADQVLDAWRLDHPGEPTADGETITTWGKANAEFVALVARHGGLPEAERVEWR